MTRKFALEPKPATAPQPSSASPGGVVFIVDDEVMVTSSLKTMLELETPHRVYCFNAPSDALAQVPVLQPEVIISDFLMPDMDGITFLSQARALAPESTLMLLTGYADKESAIQAINTVGLYRYIEKPWDNEEIQLSIKNGLERSRLMGALRKSISELTEAQDQLQQYNHQLEALVMARTLDLQITYQKLQSIVQNTADGIMTLDSDLKLTSLNPAAERWLMTRRKVSRPEDFIGLPITNILTPSDSQSIEDFFSHQQSRLIKEAFVDHVPVEVSIAPIAEMGGGYVLVLRDIVERKEIERLRDDFMSTLTHDLRTPLLAAIQTLGFFADGSLGPLTPRQSELITMLAESQKETLALVNALLEVYRYEAGRQQLIVDEVDLAPLLEGIVQELDALAQSRQQTLGLQLPPQLPKLRGDKRELRRVFVNLVGNALHFTPKGGTITVSADVTEEGGITTTVADNGRGIPARDLPLLFQRFSQGTSRQRSSGTGLGLYLSRQIVEAHQGRIGVTSVEGEGSRFFVTLPVA